MNAFENQKAPRKLEKIKRTSSINYQLYIRKKYVN